MSAQINTKCKYCDSPLHFALPVFNGVKVKLCMSKVCISQYAFDCDNAIAIYDNRICDLFIKLAEHASKVPDRFNPLPVGYSPSCLTKQSQGYIKFLNYLQVNMSGTHITEEVFTLTKNNNSINISSFAFEYSDPLEENNRVTYLFHGSPFHNWHSILRNGLKNYSNTSKMTTGAVHGNGMYFSDDLGFSSAYSGVRDGMWAVGVFEVKMPGESEQKIDEKTTPINEAKHINASSESIRKFYYKKQNIYVVPDESCARLKYLVILNNMIDLKTFGTELIESFNKRLDIYLSCVTKMSSLVVKRITRERANLLKMFPALIIEDYQDNSILTKWMLTFIGDNLINLLVTFPKNYPILPPEIRLLNKTKNHPNIIDGRLCMDILYDWNMSYNLDMVILSATEILESITLIKSDDDSQIPTIKWDEVKKSFGLIKRF